PHLYFIPIPRPPPRPTLFPYTTLFRSKHHRTEDRILELPDIARPVIGLQHRHRARGYAGDPAAGFRRTDARDEMLHQHRNVFPPDRKSTRLNSSHVKISYAVFCLKKKN